MIERMVNLDLRNLLFFFATDLKGKYKSIFGWQNGQTLNPDHAKGFRAQGTLFNVQGVLNP